MVPEVIEAIAQLGFPIVMCLLLYKSTNDQIEKLTQVVNDNTQAICRLIDKLKGGSIK